MEVRELFELTNWVQEHIEAAGIQRRYEQLLGPLQSNARQGQPNQPYEEQREDLLFALREVPLEDLSVEQTDILNEIQIYEFVGVHGADEIEDILFRNALDIASAAARINEILNSIKWGIEWSKTTRTQLDTIVRSGTTDSLDNDEVLIRVRFTSDASIYDVNDLKKWAQHWWDISRGVTLVHGETVESVRVVGASNGSIILSLATVYGVAKTIGAIANEVLAFLHKTIKVRIEIENLRALQISNEASRIAVDALKAEIEQTKAEKVEEIVANVIRRLDGVSSVDGEVTTNLKKAVSKVLDFQDKGGELDFVVPEEPDDENEDEEENTEAAERAALRDLVREMRKIESEIKALGYEGGDTEAPGE